MFWSSDRSMLWAGAVTALSSTASRGRKYFWTEHLSSRSANPWKEFRWALNKEDQEVFDRLFDRAKFHTHAGVYMAHSWPMETILVSICLEHGKMIDEILYKLKQTDS